MFKASNKLDEQEIIHVAFKIESVNILFLVCLDYRVRLREKQPLLLHHLLIDFACFL